MRRLNSVDGDLTTIFSLNTSIKITIDFIPITACNTTGTEHLVGLPLHEQSAKCTTKSNAYISMLQLCYFANNVFTRAIKTVLQALKAFCKVNADNTIDLSTLKKNVHESYDSAYNLSDNKINVLISISHESSANMRFLYFSLLFVTRQSVKKKKNQPVLLFQLNSFNSLYQ